MQYFLKIHLRFMPLSWIIAGMCMLGLLAGHAQAHESPRAEQRFPQVFRSIDGTDNNLRHPQWGSAESALLRLITVDYADGLAEPAGAHRPGPREVSNKLLDQAPFGSIPNRTHASSFLWQWGQFLDHDIDLTNAAEPPEPFDIAVPRGDAFFDPSPGTATEVIPFNRSAYHSSAVPRQQINAITAYIDASNVYGYDAVRASALRGAGGLLKSSAGNLLPFNDVGLPNAPADRSDPAAFFLAGDVRANEQIGLTSMHTLFMREHNRLVRFFRAFGLSAELRYQFARAIVGAEMQAITYNEFLPVLLGPRALAPYRGYKPWVNPGIANIFSTAAFRVGHTMLPPELLRLRYNGQPIAAGPIDLQHAFFAPQEIVQHGIEPILRGLAVQYAQEVDPFVIDAVRNFLFGPPGAGGFDLASLNIQRGRDHGLPGYNQTRRDFGLPPATSFADITSNPEVQKRLAATYASVEEIDVWVGGLAEDHLPGAMVGELVFYVLKDQFERLRDGDRFWYQRALPPSLVRYVEGQTLARVIRLNTTIGKELPDNVFRVQ